MSEEMIIDGLDEIVGIVGLQETCHVLDTDRIRTHLLKLLSILGIVFQRVDGTRCIGEGSLYVSALATRCVDRRFEVSGIVKRVEDT